MNVIDNLDELRQFASMLIGGGADSYTELLKRVVEFLGAKSGTIWNRVGGGFVPVATVSSSPNPLKLGFSRLEHEKFLQQVLSQQRSAIIRGDHTGQSGESLLLFVSSIKSNPSEVLELTFFTAMEQSQLQEFVQQLKGIPCLFEGLSKSVPRRTEMSDASTVKLNLDAVVVSRLAQTVSNSLDYSLVCSSIANESRLVLECDRVSVLKRQGKKFRLVSISGQPSVNRRSSCVQLLEELSSEILKTQKEFWYPDPKELAPQIQSKLEQYLITSPTRSFIVCPVVLNRNADSADGKDSAQTDRDLVAGVVFEHFRNELKPSTYADAVRLVMSHASTALRNAIEHQQLFLYPLWRFIGKSRLLKSARSTPKFALAACVFFIVGAILSFWPVPFYITATGRLLPEKRQYVFAKTAGEVVAVKVQQGQDVSESDAILILKNEDLQLRLSEAKGQIETLLERKSAIERSKFQNASKQNAEAIEQNLGSLQAEVEALQNQLSSLQRMELYLTVRSPMSGQIISWDPEQKLMGRTVNPQDVLLEVADVSGQWQLELDVEDRRIEHLMKNQDRLESTPLKVKYSLTADPNKTHEGELSKVGNTLQLNENNRLVLRVVANVDEENLRIKQVNTGVTARIYTGGTTSLGYLWLHEVPRALNRYVFFYLQR